MTDEPLTHVKRTQLPWRDDEGLTECGREAIKYPSITRDEAVARHKKLGMQRFAMVMCMTCIDKANVRYKAGSDQDFLEALSREIRRVQWMTEEDARKRLVDEFDAIVKLISAHRDEFDECLKAQETTINLADARRKRRA